MNKAKIVFEKHAQLGHALGALAVPAAVYYGWRAKKKGESASKSFGKTFAAGTAMGVAGTALNLRALAKAPATTAEGQIIKEVLPKLLAHMTAKQKVLGLATAGTLSGLALTAYGGIGRLFGKRPKEINAK